MTADAVKLNQLYQSQVESVGGEFIDIWDGFTDQNGEFIVTGSDINGQQVRLRTADGINLTAAGKRKVAFKCRKTERAGLLGDQASPGYRPPRHRQSIAGRTSQPAAGGDGEDHRARSRSGLSDPNLDGGARLSAALPLRIPSHHHLATSWSRKARWLRLRPDALTIIDCQCVAAPADNSSNPASRAALGGPMLRYTLLAYRGSTVAPIKTSSIARAAWRPSRIAQTTEDWPRRTSPAVQSLSTEVL